MKTNYDLGSLEEKLKEIVSRIGKSAIPVACLPRTKRDFGDAVPVLLVNSLGLFVRSGALFPMGWRMEVRPADEYVKAVRCAIVAEDSKLLRQISSYGIIVGLKELLLGRKGDVKKIKEWRILAKQFADVYSQGLLSVDKCGWKDFDYY